MKIAKQLIVTRGVIGVDIGKVTFWPLSAGLERVGMGRCRWWLPKNRSQKAIDVMEIEKFKRVFGFTPRKGTKEFVDIVQPSKNERRKDGKRY